MDTEEALKIAVLPGDGIGQEVMNVALPVFKHLNIPVSLHFGEIGWSCWVNEGQALPARTWEIINQCDAILVGAVTSKPEREAIAECQVPIKKPYQASLIQLRQNLALYANVRPCFQLNKNQSPFNFCVIRENTEGLYAGFDFYPVPNEINTIIKSSPRWQNSSPQDLSCSLRLQSRAGLTRLFRFAFQYAEKNKFDRVTLADKANVFRHSSQLSREIFESIANDYQHIKADILNVDAVAMWMVRRPEQFGVIVAENMFGDILSDVGAGIMGGLGFAASANLGETQCYFEPVHGSAPAIAKNKANPSAMFLTISLLLKQFGFEKEAQAIKHAVIKVVNDNRFVTYDLGGHASTLDMANAILVEL